MKRTNLLRKIIVLPVFVILANHVFSMEENRDPFMEGIKKEIAGLQEEFSGLQGQLNIKISELLEKAKIEAEKK